MPDPLQIGLAAAGPAIGTLASLFTKPKTSRLEKEYSRIADAYRGQLDQGYTESSGFKSALAQIRQADQRAREGINAGAARSGMTDEAKLGTIENANQLYASNLRGLMSGADAWRQNKMSNYMNSLQGAYNTRQASRQQWQSNIANITGPLGQASGSLLLADMFANKKS